MSYTIFITKDCSACVRVETFVFDRVIDCEIIMIDDSNKGKYGDLPLIYPALYEDTRLLAYGDDIITALGKRVDSYH